MSKCLAQFSGQYKEADLRGPWGWLKFCWSLESPS